VNARRILAISRRIASQFRRDHRTMALLFVVPLVVTALLGWVIRDQERGDVRLGIVASQLVAERVGAALDATPGIDYLFQADSAEAARALIRDGQVDIALVFPLDFAPGIGGAPGAGGTLPAALTVITPGVDPASEGTNLATLQRAVISVLDPNLPALIRETVWGSPAGDALDAFAPALIGFFGFFFVFLLTGISFLRERVGGTLERLLATPVTRPEIVAGYSLGFGIFAALQVAVITTFALMHVGVPALGPLPAFSVGLGIANAGSPLLAFLVVLLLAVGMVNLGIFVSTFARTELQVIQFVPVVIVPQGLLGGVLWPVDSLPSLLQPIARLLPLTYAVDGLREVMIKGADLGSAALRLDVGVLAGLAIAFAALAALTIRREVA
jgi:ABC-2 type transport system permease protein